MIAGQLELQLFADVARIRADMEKAKGIVDKGAVAMQRALSMVSTAFAALGVGAAGAGLVGMIKQINAGVDALNDLKDATGSSIENISALERVERLFGHAAGTAGNTLVKFNQALGQTLKPGSDAEAVLNALGLSAQELRAMDPAEALQQTAFALSRFADDGNKARAVQELFGKSLKEMAPFLKDLAESGRLQATVTTEQAAEAEKFAREWDKLTNSATEFGRAVGNVAVPRMNELIERFRTANRDGENLFITLAKMGALPVPPWVNLIYQGAAKAMGAGATDPKTQIANLQKLLATDGSLTAAERASYTAQLAKERSRLNESYANQITAAESSDALSRRFGRQTLELPMLPKPSGGRSGGNSRDTAAAEALKKAKEIADAREKISDISDRAIAKMAQENDAIERSNRSLDAQIELIGLSESQVKALTLARMESNLQQERENLLVAQNIEGNEVQVAQLERRIKLLAQQKELTAQEFDRKAAFDASKVASESTRKEVAEDWRGDLRGALQRAFEDSKNPAKAFVDALASTLYTRVAGRLSDALADALLGKVGGGDGGLLGGMLGLVGGGGGAMNMAALPSGSAMDLFYQMHTGGIVGHGGTMRSAHPGVFNGAPRFHTGGIAGDEVPIIAKRGEGVFTPAQMRALGGGGGPNVTVHQNFQVGESVTPSALREELKLAQRRAEAGLRRAAKYGTEGG